MLSQLRHPGVPRYLATIEEPPGTFNLVMAARARARTCASCRRGGGSREIELRDVLVRGLEILDYLHTRSPPVVHRDIKPSNIVRAPDGTIALVDFGGVLDAARDKGGSTIVGTFGYMAPEQLHGQRHAGDRHLRARRDDRRARRRHRARGRAAQGPAHGSRQAPAVARPGLRAALAAMTDPDPDKRPQRARDVVALLAKRRRRRPSRAARARRSRSGRRRTCAPAPAVRRHPGAARHAAAARRARLRRRRLDRHGRACGCRS